MAHLGMTKIPAGITWTPLKMTCGCVIDWGWDSNKVPPPVFIQWCISTVGTNCPWHGGETGQAVPRPDHETIALTNPADGVSFYARKATGDDIALGERLAEELRQLMDKVTNDKLAVIKEIPLKYRKWLYANGYDPLEAWLDQRLTDIVLNRGVGSVPPEILEMMD
ncbi:hypothetical protein [Micromonospora sp. NPDC047730]|uniref:hypothetical protein n=1 Tax=Micromonospora sp. NPDC047730 TaxID=3364253 RepID=UPI003714B0DE